jgi:6-pyruvoyltetrahydropterin/6-carboxytetrahydropterin synthase
VVDNKTDAKAMTIRLTKRYAFAASHRLHSPLLTDEQNRETFGKCNNPHGHGHNYEVEVTVCGGVNALTGRVVDLDTLDKLAEEQFLRPFRFRDLNQEVSAFRTVVPTTENLALEVDRRLREAWSGFFSTSGPQLEKVRIRETARNICEVQGQLK